MDEEVADHFGIKVGDAQARRRLTRSRGNKANQKPERIAISRDRMAACLHLRAKPVGEEALEQRRERHAGHEPISRRSEEHTSELQSLIRISYAVFCSKTHKRGTNSIITPK